MKVGCLFGVSLVENGKVPTGCRAFRLEYGACLVQGFPENRNRVAGYKRTGGIICLKDSALRPVALSSCQ